MKEQIEKILNKYAGSNPTLDFKWTLEELHNLFLSQAPDNSDALLAMVKEMNHHIESLYHEDCESHSDDILSAVMKRDIIITKWCEQNGISHQEINEK